MTVDLVPGTLGKDYISQLGILSEKMGSQPYVRPSVLEVMTVALTEYVRYGRRILADDPWEYTMCWEK